MDDESTAELHRTRGRLVLGAPIQVTGWFFYQEVLVTLRGRDSLVWIQKVAGISPGHHPIRGIVGWLKFDDMHTTDWNRRGFRNSAEVINDSFPKGGKVHWVGS